MLQQPQISHTELIECVRTSYDLDAADVAFLPVGADVDTAVYRAVTSAGADGFVKLRRGELFRPSILVPRLLRLTGVLQVIAPLETVSGRLWTELNEYTLVLYPFVDGTSGFDIPLSDTQWFELGTVLKQLHSSDMPAAIVGELPREEYSDVWRSAVRSYQELVERQTFNDPTASDLADLMRLNTGTISRVVERAESLAATLDERQPALVLCHGDIHAGNVLIDGAGSLFVVDWDTLCIAPKERDLMFIGAGIGDVWNTEREADLFYQGYGETELDATALAYYRYERIVQDISAFCQVLLLTDEGGSGRQQSIHYFASQFVPNGVIDIAMQSDPG